MSRKQKSNPNADVAEAADQAEKKANIADPIDEDAVTQRYDAPLVNRGAQALPPVVDVGPQVLSPNISLIGNNRGSFRQASQLVNASFANQSMSSLSDAQATLARMPEAERAKYMVVSNRFTGLSYVRAKPLPIEKDPLVQEMGGRKAEIRAKLDTLKPVLSTRQNEIVEKMWRRATVIGKGAKANEERPIATAKNLDKVLFRALEFFSARRAAQLGAQARNARKQRHALQNHSKPVYLPNGGRVGLNKRHQKKMATSAIVKDAEGVARVQAKAERDARTARNKAARVAVAQAFGRKVRARDLPPGVSPIVPRFGANPGTAGIADPNVQSLGAFSGTVRIGDTF